MCGRLRADMFVRRCGGLEIFGEQRIGDGIAQPVPTIGPVGERVVPQSAIADIALREGLWRERVCGVGHFGFAGFGFARLGLRRAGEEIIGGARLRLGLRRFLRLRLRLRLRQRGLRQLRIGQRLCLGGLTLIGRIALIPSAGEGALRLVEPGERHGGCPGERSAGGCALGEAAAGGTASRECAFCRRRRRHAGTGLRAQARSKLAQRTREEGDAGEDDAAGCDDHTRQHLRPAAFQNHDFPTSESGINAAEDHRGGDAVQRDDHANPRHAKNKLAQRLKLSGAFANDAALRKGDLRPAQAKNQARMQRNAGVTVAVACNGAYLSFAVRPLRARRTEIRIRRGNHHVLQPSRSALRL